MKTVSFRSMGVSWGGELHAWQHASALWPAPASLMVLGADPRGAATAGSVRVLMTVRRRGVFGACSG